jgi:CheY-like chemotaxis protein
MTATKPSIVVADDNEQILNLISGVLSADYNVVAAVRNGALALEAAETHKPDLLVMDLSMPKMNGLDAARKILLLGLPIKIILLSCEISSDYLAFATSLGASYVLKNRLDLDLQRAVEETLAGRVFLSKIP